MKLERLEDVARALVAPDKGILAADESTGTISKRFASIGVASDVSRRRDYRELLFTTPEIEQFISGVILYDETAGQGAASGKPFVELLGSKGILPGIKVDTGAKPLAGAAGETVTEGLDGLRDRLVAYRALGCRFAKWRAVIRIDAARGLPSRYGLEVNAHALARYAALCIEAGVVPIVEPEVLMDGAHDLETCFVVTERTLHQVFRALAAQRVPPEQILLKPNMVIRGSDCSAPAAAEEVAARTVACFRRTVPAAVPGIVFLSGGQSELDATANLNTINAGYRDLPWEMSFSYGRALQASALKAWGGDPAHTAGAQAAFAHRARMNSAARSGSWNRAMEEAS